MRGRLTLLYGGLFLASGVVLLGITYALADAVIANGRYHPPVPSTSREVTVSVQAVDLHQVLIPSAIALSFMAAVSIALGWLVAGRVLRPLRTITATTRQISEDNLHQRLALEGPIDELKDLGDTIDGLLSRLDAAFDAQRRFATNASHELRTPLTVGRTLIEMVLGDPDATVESFRAVCQDVLEAGAQQEQLIEALLTLARSQRGLDRRQPLDLAVIAADVAHARQPVATAQEVRLDVSVRSAALSGDPHLVERLVSNLVDNALHYNHPDGNVSVSVDTQAGQATLEVTNTGPPVAPDQLNRLLQPFQRNAIDRAGQHDGLGLGLSIVQAIATAHGADLTLQPANSGGLNVVVRFPAPPTANNGYGPAQVYNSASDRLQRVPR
ncbi:MAG: sensor histidine kinase [Acidimicrobiales bacterium]